MPVVDTATLPVHGEIPHQQSVYCGLDCCITMEVLEGLLSLGPPPPLYTFLRDLQAPFLEMQLRGFRVDHGEMLRVLGRLNGRVGALREWLNELGGSLDMPELNPRSQPQKQEMVRRLFLPERWVSVKGVRKFPMDRDALEWYDSMYLYARPFCRAIQACQDTYSDIKTLETEVRRGRWHTSWNLTGTDTGRLSSSAAWDGTGCVLPAAEALTRKGWKQIDQVMDGEEIAQYDEGVIEFVPCRVFRKRYSGDILTVQSEQLKLTVTPEHRILHFGPQNDSIFVERADIVRNRSQEAIPLGGKLYQGGGKYPPYLSMLMADFSKEGSGWRGQLKKQRKIDRFLALALAFDIPYTEQKAPEGYRRFYIPGHLAWPKKWGSWVLDLDYSSACALIDEARYWDGHDRGSGFWFFTADKEQAEWFATLVHLVGRGATIRHTVSPEGSFNPGGIMWTVNVKTRGHAQIKRKHWGRDIYNGYVYCPSVPSSFWLVRQDGFISVTGNSNLQNITRDGAGENASPDDLHLRRMFIADDDRVLVSMDRKQSEAREVGYLLGLLFDDWKYLDLLETTDIHTYVAREVWQDLPWTGDIKRDRAIAERPYYRNNSYRDMAKKLAHGCVTADHEVLTPQGWVDIAEKPDYILVYDPVRRTSEFSHPTHWTDKEWTGEMVELAGNSLSLYATSDHRVLLTKDGKRGAIQEFPAGDMPKVGGIPLGGGYIGGPIRMRPQEARLFAAFQCDGSRQSSRSIRFHMSKERKFERLEKLAKECGFPYRRTRPDNAVVSAIGIGDWVKVAGPYILDWKEDAIAAYVDEHKWWNGHVTKFGHTTIYSKDRQHLEWLQTLGRIVGIGGDFTKECVSGYGTTIHRLQQNNRQYANIGCLYKIEKKEVKGVRVYCPTVATGAFYIRRNGKISVTGNSSYCGSAHTMAHHAHCSVSFVERFQERFLDHIFPAFRKWHRWVAERLQLDGELENLFGDKRQFFDDPLAPETLRKAVAYIPQSSTARRTNMGVLALWRSGLPIELLAQGHDSITYQCRQSDLTDVIPQALALTEVTLIAPNGRKFVVPGDCKVGWNWGNWAKDNPNGLKEWKGEEGRKRLAQRMPSVAEMLEGARL